MFEYFKYNLWKMNAKVEDIKILSPWPLSLKQKSCTNVQQLRTQQKQQLGNHPKQLLTA